MEWLFLFTYLMGMYIVAEHCMKNMLREMPMTVIPLLLVWPLSGFVIELSALIRKLIRSNG